MQKSEYFSLEAVPDWTNNNHTNMGPVLNLNNRIVAKLRRKSENKPRSSKHKLVVKSKNHYPDGEEENINIMELCREGGLVEQSVGIIKCLKLKPFVLEDDEGDDNKTICFVPDSSHVHITKNNN